MNTDPRQPVAARRALPAPAALAAAGSVLMTLASWWVGATPVRFAHERPGPLGWFPAHSVVPFAVFYLGLAAFCAAWLTVGRWLVIGPAPSARQLRVLLAAGAAPFVFAAPFGRDLWAYAAQGNVAAHGLDPYRHGPAAVPGAFTAEVSGRWVHSPTPYGPLWVRLSQAADWLSGGHPTVAALLLRLPSFAGLALCAWAIGVLARSTANRRIATTLWLGVASPLTIVLGVGGGHNDLIMLGLALAGLAVATRPSPTALAAGAALATAAVLIKSPAAIAVAFTVPIWLRVNRPRWTARDLVIACATAVAGCAVTAVAISAASGLGTGWTRQVNSDAQWVSWLSLPSGIGMLAHAVTGTPLKAVDETMRACRTAAEVILVVALVLLWLAALRRRVNPLLPLTIALAVAALLAPSVQPWYYCWALAVAGLVVMRRVGLVLLAAVGLMFAVMITPDGFGLESGPWAPVIVAVSVAVCWWALPARTSAPDNDRADHAGPEVRADDRTEFGHV
jgi:alpha-1,6-mannosyltransferase